MTILDDIAAAKQTLDIIIDLMERSGVGALPLLDIDTSGRAKIPTEEQLVETATKRVQVNFEKLKRAQESAAVVTNLLTTEHRPQKNASACVFFLPLNASWLNAFMLIAFDESKMNRNRTLIMYTKKTRIISK